MDYKDTLNLPKTGFKMKANLPQREPEILKSWEQMDIYRLLRKKSEGLPKYILHDGPPYANGNVHLGTGLNKILKDIVVKYKSMWGFDAPFVPGWDCHGMPIEYNVVRSFNEKKKEVTQAVLRSECRRYAEKFVKVQRKQFKRLGVFGDWERPYLTMSREYEAKIVEIFGELVEQGYIYQGLKPVHWCAGCRTALANAEVEYDEHTSPSIYVKFPLKEEPDKFLLVWTTTPWTLFGNVSVAVRPDYRYAVVKNGDETLILAEKLVEDVMSKKGCSDYQKIGSISGKKQERKVYVHPLLEREGRVTLADFVTGETGTGCVHIAPGHGQEDYLLGLKYKLPVLSPVDDKGVFTSEAGRFAGQNVFDANKGIIEELDGKGYLLHTESILHSYPHCWRCKKPLIFRATKQWFMSLEVNDLRERITGAIPGVRWLPSWGEDKFRNTVAQSPDWCISRQRAWGVPIPAFYCNSCGEVLLSKELIGRFKEIVLKKGVEVWFEEGIEKRLLEGARCGKCGESDFRKETSILDVWVDSGMSCLAVLEPREELSFPADLYLEAVDQHRGWFQISLIVGMATRNASPYKAVLTHGLILDEQGKKMSKLLGNVVSPDEIVGKFGSDILRFWFASSDYSGNIRFSHDSLESIIEAYRKVRNTYKFILGNLYDFDSRQDVVEYPDLFPVDRWALLELQKLIKAVTASYDRFEFHRVFHLVYNFCTIALSSFYLDILKDRLYTFPASSLRRRSAQTVLFEIGVALNRILAPVLTYTAEEVWSYLRTDEDAESVHLCSWPEVREDCINEELEAEWQSLFGLRTAVLKEIEKKREEGLVGSSLEAGVNLYYSGSGDETLKKYKDELAAIFVTSQVNLSGLEAGDYQKKKCADYKLNATELKIEIKKAEGNKCSRCWNYSLTVGENKKHPELCRRCVEAIKQR